MKNYDNFFTDMMEEINDSLEQEHAKHVDNLTNDEIVEELESTQGIFAEDVIKCASKHMNEEEYRKMLIELFDQYVAY